METLTMGKDRERDLEKIIADGISKGIREAKIQEQKSKGNSALNTFMAIAIFVVSIFGGVIISGSMEHYFNIPTENTMFGVIFLCSVLLTYLWTKKEIKEAWNTKRYGLFIFMILIMVGGATFTGLLIAK